MLKDQPKKRFTAHRTGFVGLGGTLYVAKGHLFAVISEDVAFTDDAPV